MDKFLSVDAAVCDLKGKAMSLAGRVYIEASTVSLEAYGTPASSTIKALSNGRHSGLGPQFNIWIANSGGHEKSVEFALEGSVRRFDQCLKYFARRRRRLQFRAYESTRRQNSG